MISRTFAVLALCGAALVSAAAYPQQPEPGRAGGGRGRGGGGRGGRGDVLIPTALIAERNLTANDFPTLRSTTGNVYVWQDVHNLGFLTNNLIVITSDGVLVADGQGRPEAVRKLVDAVKLLTPQPIKYVVVCSEHGDHTGGNEAFPATATFISSPASQANLARAARTPDTNGRKTMVPKETVADRRILKMGGTEIHILNSGRSHTGGDLQVYLPQEKVLFTSETFSHRIFPSMANAYPSEWIQTLKKVQQIDATFVVPGHGFLDPAPTMKTEIGEFEKALEYVVGEVRRIHSSGVNVEEGLKQVDWGPYRSWSVAERNGPPALRRIYDELDGKLK
jgi:glyoxylase-like metal-dependent hydrolase (beta-lactamase superfamily II)